MINRKESISGCVYFIRLKGLKPIKIGYSAKPTPTKRIQNYNSPYGVELIGFFPTDGANIIEKEIHHDLERFKIKGEWFDITVAQVKEIIYLYQNNYENDIQKLKMFMTEYAVTFKQLKTAIKKACPKVWKKRLLKENFKEEIWDTLNPNNNLISKLELKEWYIKNNGSAPKFYRI